MSRIVRSLCAVPAFGSFGAPALGSLGGITGITDTPAAVDVDTLEGRSTNPPGTTMPAVGNPDRLAFNVIDATYFDGSCALYNIPSWLGSVDSTTRFFSASYWINISDTASPPVGNVFGFACNTPLTFGSTYVVAPMSAYQGVDGVFPAFESGLSDVRGVMTFNNRSGYGFSNFVLPHGFSSPALDQGWVNVLFSISCSTSTRQVTVNLYCNDTPVTWFNHGYPVGDTAEGTPLSNLVIPADHFFDSASFGSSSKMLMRFLNADDAMTNSYSCIGGAAVNGYLPRLPTTGNGLVGCLAEVWLGPGQFIDFSVLANRQKFHSSDLAQLAWAPVSLGANGSTPTGTKPLVYCTGRPDQIKVNRATGRLLQVYGDLTLCTDAPPS